MNKKSVFLNLLSLYGMTFMSTVNIVKNQKFDFNDEEIVHINTEKLLNSDEMNIFCEDCS